MGKSKNKHDGMSMPKQRENQPLEDRVMKSAALFMGDKLLSLLGIKGKVKRIAPTEQVYLEMKDFLEDFNYEMEDGTWKHLEFESDSLSVDDLRRFRAYEAVISYHYKTEVSTYVLCSSGVTNLISELAEGLNTYRVQVIRMKDWDASQMIETLERKDWDQWGRHGNRKALLEVLLTPLMGGSMPQAERIKRSLGILKKAQTYLDTEELSRMQAVLYALAIKFLKEEELVKMKEVFSMTVLGEMLVNDGMEKGMEKGIEKGLVQMICKKMRKGRTLETIADELEEEIYVIAPIYEVASKFFPDYDSELVYEEVEAQGIFMRK
ncbi:MAG: hypothetical protein HFH82_13200 [Lachnospiraceae bacterium]|nr:hypothetical protein [Lachnospiraceae bacterium]